MDSLRYQVFSAILIPVDFTHRPHNQQGKETYRKSYYEHFECTPDKVHYTTHPAPLTAHVHHAGVGAQIRSSQLLRIRLHASNKFCDTQCPLFQIYLMSGGCRMLTHTLTRTTSPGSARRPLNSIFRGLVGDFLLLLHDA